MIEKKFLRNGNSWCVIIPTSVIKMLGINPEEDNIQLLLENGNILIKPIKSKNNEV
jgi:antitoxin component of MazEF toxin-antitoxin module